MSRVLLGGPNERGGGQVGTEGASKRKSGKSLYLCVKELGVDALCASSFTFEIGGRIPTSGGSLELRQPRGLSSSVENHCLKLEWRPARHRAL